MNIFMAFFVIKISSWVGIIKILLKNLPRKNLVMVFSILSVDKNFASFDLKELLFNKTNSVYLIYNIDTLGNSFKS